MNSRLFLTAKIALVACAVVASAAAAESGTADLDMRDHVAIVLSPEGNAPNSASSFPKPLYPGFRSETFSFHVDADAIASAAIELEFSAPEAGSHRVLVHLNDEFVGELDWQGKDMLHSELRIDPALLKAGENTLDLSTGRVKPEDARISYLERGRLTIGLSTSTLSPTP